METQDASGEFLIKFWPWFETNRKRLIYVAVGAVLVLFIWYFIATQRDARSVQAGQDYTKLQLSLASSQSASEVAAAYVKLAAQYDGTPAAERAQLQAAAVLFNAGSYQDALLQFKKFSAANGASQLAAAAHLGAGTCLETLGKLDEAVTEYRAVATGFPNSAEALPAKFDLGRVLEMQGKLSDASSYYQEVTRSQLAGSLGQEAAQRLAGIQAKLAAAKPVAKP